MTISDVHFADNQGKLAVEAHFSTGWFGARGTLYFEGTPHLSGDHNTLEIRDPSLDVRTKEKLLDGAVELAEQAVLEAIAEKLRFDLRPVYESALANLRKRATELKIAEGVDVAIDIQRVSLDDVLVGDGKLVAVGAAMGTLSLAVK